MPGRLGDHGLRLRVVTLPETGEVCAVCPQFGDEVLDRGVSKSAGQWGSGVADRRGAGSSDDGVTELGHVGDLRAGSVGDLRVGSVGDLRVGSVGHLGQEGAAGEVALSRGRRAQVSQDGRGQVVLREHLEGGRWNRS